MVLRQPRSRLSGLIRSLILCFLLLAAVFSWATGLCAVSFHQNVSGIMLPRFSSRTRTLVKVPSSSINRNCSPSATAHIEPSTHTRLPLASIMIKWRLRGLSLKESGYALQLPKQPPDHHCELSRSSTEPPRNGATAQTLNIRHMKRRRLSVQMYAETCTASDISITQGLDSSHGIPEFVVEVVNTCLARCSPSDIHISCGWFSSALLVNPALFRRIAFDDCLVNNGRPLNYDGCTDRDISISQSQDTLAAGVPQFIVQIYSTCTMGGCAPSDIHVNCGWFASKVVVNPGIFRRVAFDDCLVNSGHPIQRGQILRFTYQNSFMYPLSFKSAQFC